MLADMRFPAFGLVILNICAPFVHAQFSVYRPKDQVIFGGDEATSTTDTASAAAATYTGAAAYDPTVLEAPAPPNPGIATSFAVQLNAGVTGLSIQQKGAFFGFSVEMSVANHVLGKNSTVLQVPFLNLLANVQQRAGSVVVRVGGNTQESAVVVDSLPNGAILEKNKTAATNPTATPPLEITPDLLYMMGNISALTNTRWYLGLPFYVTDPFALEIVEQGQAILGDTLLGFQAGNEPDLYADHGHRNATYSQFDYFGEIDDLVTQISQDTNIPNPNDLLLVPSVSTNWSPESVFDTGIVNSFGNSLGALTVEHYPENNCAALYNTGGPVLDPQTEFPNYLNHTSAQTLVVPYINSTVYAQSVSKPLIMFETNTASCSGFPGISNSFGAALWSLDWAMTMAFNNFSTALFHTGGQSAYYNPFTPPPTNQSTFRQWTVGPVYYAALVMAEALGPSNKSQIFDLGMNSGNMFTPGYAIYEDGVPTKVLMLNFITDASGASTYTASISFPGAVPASVRVKYLSADSVSQKGNFTWAGQTLGNNFESDGRLVGDLNVQTVQCDQTNNVCAVTVPAPSVALVFLTDDAYSEVSPTTQMSFPTTIQTRTVNTVSIDASAVATSNGHSGAMPLAATSQGSRGSAPGMRYMMPGLLTLASVAAGVWVMGRR